MPDPIPPTPPPGAPKANRSLNNTAQGTYITDSHEVILAALDPQNTNLTGAGYDRAALTEAQALVTTAARRRTLFLLPS